MATKKLMLNKARRLNDGTYPLVMQLLHQRKKRVIYSGVYLYPQEFDQQKRRVIPCTEHYRYPKDIRKKNKIINEFVSQINNIITMLETEGKPYTCHDIVDLYHINGNDSSLINYWQTLINEYRKMERFGIADAQQSTLNSIIRFSGTPYIGVTKVTPEFIRNYEQALLERDISPNTICYYMRNFKTVMNRISKERLTKHKIDTLFDGIKTSPRKTVKRAITRTELRSLAQITFYNEPLLELARDLFMFSFYTRGMSFVDIAFLRRDNISDDAIHYLRQKTGQHLQVNINHSIHTLIAKYATASQFLFPIVSSEDAAQAYKEYRCALRRINKALKIIGKRLGLNVELTTYVARHSWATQAKEQGFPVAVISEGLGHSSENTTRIYLKGFDHSVLDKANDVITYL